MEAADGRFLPALSLPAAWSKLRLHVPLRVERDAPFALGAFPTIEIGSRSPGVQFRGHGAAPIISLVKPEGTTTLRVAGGDLAFPCGAAGGCTNVWGRELEGGRIVLVFVNNAASDVHGGAFLRTGMHECVKFGDGDEEVDAEIKGLSPDGVETTVRVIGVDRSVYLGDKESKEMHDGLQDTQTLSQIEGLMKSVAGGVHAERWLEVLAQTESDTLLGSVTQTLRSKAQS